MGNDPMLVLASGSPRRRELMTLTGIPYMIDVADVDEHTEAGACEAVQILSKRKASAVAEKHPGKVILGSDTLVAIDNISLGKPSSKEEAFTMLRKLSGRTHQVYTGVTVIGADGQVWTDVDTSDVTLAEMTDEEINWYIATGEPMDKAGAYAMQGIATMWVTEVKGTPSGVIGLPMPLTCRLLKKAGISILNPQGV